MAGDRAYGTMARIALTGYNSVNDAYNAAGANDDILAVTGTSLIGDLVMDQVKNITLKGSYHQSFSRTTSQPTLLQGKLVIQNGSLRVNGVKLK